MSTNLKKVEVFIETPIGNITSSSVSVMHSINDIPTAEIQVIPTKEFTNIEKMMFKDISVKVGINGKEDALLTGSFIGAETMSSTLSVQEVITLKGGLYKLSQMGTIMPGLHVFGEHSMFRLSMLSTDLKKLFAGGQSQASSKNNIIQVFGEVLNGIFTAISQLNVSSSDNVNTFYTSFTQSLSSIFKLHQQQGSKVLREMLSSIMVSKGLDATTYDAYERAKVQNTIQNISNSPNGTFWNLLIAMCEIYQIHLGTFKNITFAVPASPVGQPAMNIPLESIKGIRISPFPIYAPTRCYFTTDGNPGSSYGGIPATGMFPPPERANKLTKFEEKLGTIRPLVYQKPGFALHRKGPVSTIENNMLLKAGGGIVGGNIDAIINYLKDEGEQIEINRTPVNDATYIKNSDEYMAKIAAENNKFAQVYLAKETFKHRTGTLELKFSPNIPVGMVVTFEDPVYKKEYQGYITRVSHSINSNSISTTLFMQYVMSKDEMDFLGLSSDGYLTNLAYPDYKPKDLAKMLGI